MIFWMLECWSCNCYRSTMIHKTRRILVIYRDLISVRFKVFFTVKWKLFVRNCSNKTYFKILETNHESLDTNGHNHHFPSLEELGSLINQNYTILVKIINDILTFLHLTLKQLKATRAVHRSGYLTLVSRYSSFEIAFCLPFVHGRRVWK
jgi:hypothetical protein